MAQSSVKSIRPIAKSSHSAPIPEKELREQLHQEIEKKSKACSNPTFLCSMQRVDGYEYCARHILRDQRAPYRQCTHIYTNGRKCVNALPKHDLKKDPAMTTLCFEHSRQAQLRKTRTIVGKLARVETNEIYLHHLSAHLKLDDAAKKQSNDDDQDEEIDVVSPYVPPFLGYEQAQDISVVTSAIKKRRRVLDYASDSSSEGEAPCFSNTARGHELHESDAETADEDDCLKHAGIYTRQEAVRIARDKLIKLQNLYIDQLDHLHHVLKEKRRRYLHSIRKEREVYCSIHDQVKENPKERHMYEQFKAMNSYHRRHGVEAILFKKYKEKRTRTAEGYVPKVSGFGKCTYVEGGVKCTERSMPLCKFCRRHILEDKKQVLFRACSVERSGIVCKEPIPCIADDSTCVLHITLPPKRLYLHKKYESETEEEEPAIKKELPIIKPIERKKIKIETETRAKPQHEKKVKVERVKFERRSGSPITADSEIKTEP